MHRACQGSQKSCSIRRVARLSVRNSTEGYTDGSQKGCSIRRVARLSVARLGVLLDYPWLDYTCSTVTGVCTHLCARHTIKSSLISVCFDQKTAASSEFSKNRRRSGV